MSKLKSLQDRFAEAVQRQGLLAKTDKILLALSGGVDSMVLAELLWREGYHLALAHCNFHLRGEASDGDEAFVRRFAESRGVAIYVEHFDTTAYARRQGISIEMAARELRYQWFETLRIEYGYDKVALAHHSDDQIETFFINLLRSSGLQGLKGMPQSTACLVRPLLSFSRHDIEDFARSNGIQWREDHTNKESLFLRNKIRNELLPHLEQIAPSARQAIGRSISFLNEENNLYRALLTKELERIVHNDGRKACVRKDDFDGITARQLVFEWLRDYGFNTDQCHSIYVARHKGPGICFYSQSHCLSVERDVLELFELSSDADIEPSINADTTMLSRPVPISFCKVVVEPYTKIQKSLKTATLDFDRLRFPLRLRRWKQGDKFQPLGMRGKKLLSDFFVSQKFTALDKREVLLLVDADDAIVWVVGHRIDDRFKVTHNTTTLFMCSLL